MLKLDNSIEIIRSVFKDRFTCRVEPLVFVDGTCGLGRDTLFLANLCRNSMVYTFDIQAEAIERAKELTCGNENIVFIHDSHHLIKNYVRSGVDGAIFNFGYLPGGDKGIVTSPMTSLEAVISMMGILKDGGLIGLTIYPGHSSGRKEEEGIVQMLSVSDPKLWQVSVIRNPNRGPDSPYTIFIEKRSVMNEQKR